MYITGSAHAAAGARDDEELITQLLEQSEYIKQCFFGPSETEQVKPISRDTQPVSTCLTLTESLKRKPSHRTRRLREPPPECTHCGSTALTRDEIHADVVCTHCGTCHVDRVTNEAYKSLSFHEFSNLKAASDAHRKKNVYKKKNYFGEVLGHITGRDDSQVSEQLVDAVLQKQAHLHQDGPVSAVEVRAALKSLKARKDYKYAWSIAKAINKRRNTCPNELSHTEEDLLRYMFNKVHRTFYEVRGLRKNCLNYCYVIQKMLYLINRSDLSAHLPTLKTRFRLEQHDTIWRGICAKTGWEFRALCPERSRR